ncbi:hypothetical protein GQ457_01G025370 [Hibiscus cannabinus]
MAAIVETYEANTKMMKQNNKILQEILKQVKLVSKRLGIEDEGEISDAGKVEAKQDGPHATIHHMFDQLSTPNEGDVGDQTIQNYEGLQIREKLIIASSNDIGVTENHVKDDIYPVFGSDMLVQLDEVTEGESISNGADDINAKLRMVLMPIDNFELSINVWVDGCKSNSFKAEYNENTIKSFILRRIDASEKNKHVKCDDPYGFRLLLMGEHTAQITMSLSGTKVTLCLGNTEIRVLGLKEVSKLVIVRNLQVWDIFKDLKILSLRKHRLSFVLFSAVVWLLGYAMREFAQHGVQPGDLAIIFKETVTLYGHPTQRIRLILSIKIVKENVPIKTLVSTSAKTFKCQILIIATGSTIVRLIDFDGQRAEAKNIFYLGEIDDADKLVEANKAKKNGKADIVGEGYTELELGAASHTPLECALQTHPNITVIGEDVVAKKLSLKNLDYVSVCLPNASCRGHFTQQASLLLFMLDTKVESLKGFSRLNLEDKFLFSGGGNVMNQF